MSGYLFLILTVFCFFSLGVLHKVADFQKCRPLVINAFLFFSGGLLITTYTVILGFPLSLPRAVGGVATLCGILASIAILCFQSGIRYGKISTSWLVINLSTAVPTVLSIVYYGEHVGMRRGIALLAIALSLLFLWKDKQLESAQTGKLHAAFDPAE